MTGAVGRTLGVLAAGALCCSLLAPGDDDAQLGPRRASAPAGPPPPAARPTPADPGERRSAAPTALVRALGAPERRVPAQAGAAPARSRPRSAPAGEPREPAGFAPPSEAAVRELEAATERGDADALLALVHSDRGLLRFEALQRLLELRGPAGLEVLVSLIEGVDDDLARFACEGLAAGGAAPEAVDLAGRLPSLAPSRRGLAAAAVASIAGRDPGARAVLPGAAEALVDEVRRAGGAAEEACWALADAGLAGQLDELAADGGVLPELRSAAAVALATVAGAR